ncbi:MAG: 50S ribosomal protein L25 [Elusimicrobia bacterium]|nr:50S ribosomal protein L25 [Elusimicrobiota bacterium]
MELNLEAKVRDSKSKKAELTKLRKDRMIPGVVYGGKKSPVNVVVNEKELTKLVKAGGANAIIHLKTAKGDDTVILKELQRHVVNNQPIHADFQRISMTAKIEVKVPLHVVGEAPGVKTGGGILEHVLREFKVRALPAKIPQKIDLDVSNLQLNQSIHVKDVAIPEGVEVLDALDHIVVNIVQPTAEEVVAPAPGAEGAAAGTEPEVIAKGKKEEEGAEGEKKEGAKAAAPAKEEKKAEAKK